VSNTERRRDLSRRPAEESDVPRLAGQHADYLEQQLHLLQGRRRGGTENVRLMHAFVARLRPEEIRDVTLYYGSGAAPLSTTYGPR
jgi:cytochrome c553